MTKFPARINRVSIGEAACGNESQGPAEYKSEGPDPGPAAGNGLSSSKLFRNIKGIIFDFDGTLFDNKKLPFYLISAYPPDLLRIFRERQTRKQFSGRDFTSPDEFYKAFFTTLGKACARSPERMRIWYFTHYMPRMVKTLKNHYKLRPGVMELFRLFESAPQKNSGDLPKVAIYSDYPMLKERLGVMGFTPEKNILLYGPESFGAQKPAVRPFLKIASEMKATPEEILVIGDREDTDGIGAFRAGMRFFCLETGRKRYFRLDPNRKPPDEKSSQRELLLMYTGIWDDLIKLLMEKYDRNHFTVQSPSA